MNIEKLIDELKNNEDVYELSLLYLKVKGAKKDHLLELYNKGMKLGENNVPKAIYLAIKEDKEAIKVMQEMIAMQAIGNMSIPSYNETMKTMKEHSPTIDPELANKIIKKK